MSDMVVVANCKYCICLFVGFDIIIEHPNPHVMKTCELIKGRKCTIVTCRTICRYITNFAFLVLSKTKNINLEHFLLCFKKDIYC